MLLTSYIFKSKAVRALKGNWQTALIVSFIAALPSTINAVLRSTQMPEIASYAYEDVLAAAQKITPQSLWLMAIVGVLTFLVTPVLTVGSNNYFLQRIQGKELGIAGVASRMKLFGKALLLYLWMYLRIFLWTLLLLIPGVVAALPNSMAPYFLAENPEIGINEAINKSKAVMADKKFSLFVLLFSFIGWALLAMAAQVMLISFSAILAMVAYQFVDLFRITYMNASVAAFYLAASRTEGVEKAKMEADAFVRELQSRSPYGPSRNAGGDTEKPEETPDAQDKDSEPEKDELDDEQDEEQEDGDGDEKR